MEQARDALISTLEAGDANAPLESLDKLRGR